MASMKPWIAWSLRSAAALHLLGVLAHRDNAGFTHAALYLQLVAAILLWRPGRGPAWPAWATAALVAAETAQVAMGHDRVLSVHFPLGVAVFGASAVLTFMVWRVTR
jgi:hypothetical protein